MLWYHFEESNHAKSAKRLGLEDFGTVKFEQLHLIKAMASQAGFSDDELPYEDLPEPATIEVKESGVLDFSILHLNL